MKTNINQVKQKILFISHSSELWGAERNLIRLVDSLLKTQFEPIIVCPHSGPLVDEFKKKAIRVEIVKMKIWFASKLLLLRFLYRLFFHLRGAIKIAKIIRQNNVVLVHTNSLVIIDGAIAAKLTRLPHVWHVREILDDNPEFKFLLGWKFALKFAYNLTTQFICVAKAVENQFSQIVENDQKFKVIYNGTEISRFSNFQQSPEYSYSLDSNKYIVGLIGSITPRKGHEIFIEAANIAIQEFDKIKFLIVGKSNDADYEKKLHRLIRDYGLDKYFTCLDFQKDIIKIMSSLDILVVPSWAEPFPGVILEAMAMEKPVITTNSGGIPEAVIDGVTGIIVPAKDPESLASAIIMLANDRKLVQKMGKLGRKRVEKFFNSSNCAQNILNIYKEILR